MVGNIYEHDLPFKASINSNRGFRKAPISYLDHLVVKAMDKGAVSI